MINNLKLSTAGSQSRNSWSEKIHQWFQLYVFSGDRQQMLSSERNQEEKKKAGF